jgi:nucleotide-binding universal stress UspA family protein
MTKIIVGVDESTGSASALRWAVEEARERGWAVEAVLVWGLLNQHHPAKGTAWDPDYDAGRAGDALESYVRAAVGDAPVVRQLVNDLPARGLLDLADHDDVGLLVVGGRGLGDIRGAILGSVSNECLHRTTGPIAMVRAGMVHHREDPRRIVVGIDGSASGRLALEWADAEAAARGAELEVVHAWRVPYLGGPFAASVALEPKPFEKAARSTLDEAVADIAVGRGVVPTLTFDGAASALLTAGKSADLVVVGARGVGGFAGLLLGSTSHQVVHHAECPVVVVPSRR